MEWDQPMAQATMEWDHLLHLAIAQLVMEVKFQLTFQKGLAVEKSQLNFRPLKVRLNCLLKVRLNCLLKVRLNCPLKVRLN